jgi:hypothetical protein
VIAQEVASDRWPSFSLSCQFILFKERTMNFTSHAARQFAMPTALVIAVMVVAGFTARGQSDGKTATSDASQLPPKSIVSTHDLMELFNQPLLTHLKSEMDKPANEREAGTIVDRGWQVAEIANLVALRKNDRQWVQLSSQLQQAGIHLAETAKGEDAEATDQAYRNVLHHCNACHDKFGGDHAPQISP